jgi:ketosteroid isomerase-like protein
MENAQLATKLRQAYEQWAASKGMSNAHWFELMAPEVHFQSLGDGARGLDFTAPKKGREGVHAYFDGLAADWEMLHFIVDDIIVDGTRAAVQLNMAWRNKHTGRVLNSKKADIWRFENGLAVDFMEYYDTRAAVAAAER